MNAIKVDSNSAPSFNDSSQNKLNKINDLYRNFILNDYKVLRNKNLIAITAKKFISNLIDNLQKLLLLLNNTGSTFKTYSTGHQNDHSQQTYEDAEFVRNNNDQVIEIIVYIGEIIENLAQNEPASQELSDFYSKYSDLVLNIAEKSPLKFDHIANNLNKTISLLINSSFNLFNQTAGTFVQKLNLGKLCYEIYRALGSLIYQNGPKLNEYNLNRLLIHNQNNSFSNLLGKVRIQIENDLANLTRTNFTHFSDETFDLINKLNLISTQLIFNLTMPIKISDSNLDSNLVDLEFIDDKYKAKCACLLIKTLRFNNSTQISLNKFKNESQSYVDKINKHFSNSKNNFHDDEFNLNTTKILSKALQGLENLFQSIKIDQQSVAGLNWIQSCMNEFQLGDILAILKDLSFFGIQTKTNKNTPENECAKQKNKLEPSNLHEILLPLERDKKQTEFNESQINSNKTEVNFESDDENKNQKNFSKTPTKKPYKKYNNNKSKPNKFNKQPNQISEHLNELNSNNNNSIQCLREAQVPLIHYKNNFNNSQVGTDSDVSTDSSTSSFYLEKSNAKVRVAAVGVLLTIFQRLEKRTILSYWDSFLGSANNNLIYSIKNDPSPKVRLIAATALSVYLECVRQFFTIAASEDTVNSSSLSLGAQASSFLPISFTIASIIRQLHKDLFFCLNQRETFQLNQIQLLKCLQCLIKATPYQKLKPGLIYKLILSLNMLLDQKTTQRSNSQNVLIEILACLEIILSNHHQMLEVHLALLSPISKSSSFLNQNQNLSKFSSSSSSLSELTSDELDLSSKLEKLSTNIKVPNLSQTRVKYFYEANNSFSLTGSNSVSGHITPSYPVSDLVQDENIKEANNKSWLVAFCLLNSSINQSLPISLGCLDLLTVICRKYFDLLKRDLFFEDICRLIMENIDNSANSSDFQLVNQIKLKTLKFLEEFARCLATNDLRQINSIDLNDCCKFWSNLLNSKLLTEYLVDEQRYLLSSTACDCLASIGASIFELLPFQKRIFCLTNLLHLTKSQSSLIRAASVRALGVYVTFTSLKEDQNFLNDLSVCLLTLLQNDSNNLVRQKTAWSMSNLSEVMIENGDRLANIFTDEFNLTVWLRLLDSAANSCQRESDKLKSYLVRTLGNLINYISLVDLEFIKSQLNLSIVERSITRAVEVLCGCRNVKMLKVKWNLSHAIGVSMKKFNTWKLHCSNPKWLQMFYDTLLELFTQSNNFKVRINACIALMTINLNDISLIRTEKSSDQGETIYIKLWICLVEAFSKLKNESIDATNELQHKNTLTHQLCKLYTYLCKYLRIDDLEKVMLKSLNDLKLNPSQKQIKKLNLSTNELRNYLVSYINTIYDEIEINKQEVQFYNEALTQLNFLNSNKQTSIDEDCINLLNNLLQKPAKANKSAYDESDTSEAETLNTDNENDLDTDEKHGKENEYRKKFPFKSVYD